MIDFKKSYFLNIDVVGTISGERYVGQFEVKKYLVHKDTLSANRLLQKVAQGLDKGPSFDVNSLVGVLKEYFSDEQTLETVYL